MQLRSGKTGNRDVDGFGKILDGLNFDNVVKSHWSCLDGHWNKFDIQGVVSESVIRQYIWYGELPIQIYNDVDRAFYESIIFNTINQILEHTITNTTSITATENYNVA